MSAHAQAGKENEAARTIPVRNASEIHNKGINEIVQQNKT
jgi:predicted RNA binding protein YcfA (HicA-like mRNA interferase family)